MEILPSPRYESVLYTVSKMTCYRCWRIWLLGILLLCSVGQNFSSQPCYCCLHFWKSKLVYHQCINLSHSNKQGLAYRNKKPRDTESKLNSGDLGLHGNAAFLSICYILILVWCLRTAEVL